MKIGGSHLVQSILIISFMLLSPQSVNSLRIAVLGSGVAGSTAARTLADRGIQVTVFEAGHGIGGRSSTRITRDENRFQFDHGAQYISSPKTEVFRNALSKWEADGWVKQWQGNFFSVDKEGIVHEDEKKERWVGKPAMHSICRNLLHHDNIRVQLQTRANASYKDTEDSKWNLVHGKSKENLGNYDWLIVSDRISAAHYRRDLSYADVNDFRIRVRKTQTVKSLAAMIVFQRSLGLDMNGIQFNDNGAVYGSLGWAARDSSKPSRSRKDGKECWVLHSHPNAAKEILKGTQNTTEIRERIKDTMVGDFLKSIPLLAKNDFYEIPPVVYAVGHRWGAAFPIPSDEFADKESELIADRNFVACGDYFGKLSGRYEGAYLSGVSAANQLCKIIQ